MGFLDTATGGMIEGLPSFGGANLIPGTIIFLLIAITVGGLTFYFANKRAYKFKIHIFEEISGQAVPTGEDKAREIVLPNTSIRAYFLKNRKLYLPRPSKQIGKGHFWFFIRKDGEWVNFELTNMNKEMNRLNINFDHTDMRMANAALKKLVEQSYKKMSWMKEYAPYIAVGILILLFGISAFLVLKQVGSITSQLNSGVVVNNEVVSNLNEILKSMDNICTGSGVRSVG